MSAVYSIGQASALLRAVIPDLDARAEKYRVTLAPPDAELVAALVEHVAEELPALEAADAAGDHARIAAGAHGFKGMGGAVGLPEISVLGEALEQAAQRACADEVHRLVRSLGEWRKAMGGGA